MKNNLIIFGILFILILGGTFVYFSQKKKNDAMMKPEPMMEDVKPTTKDDSMMKVEPTTMVKDDSMMKNTK